MSVVPGTRSEKIVFYENHVGPWAANAVAIGTSTLATTDLTTKTTAARAAFNAHIAAQQAAKAAVEAYYAAVSSMANAGSDIILQIRTKAATAGNSIYQLAEIPAPATPTPAGAPGTPTDLKAALTIAGEVGIIDLTWKNKNATGCVYMVYRQVGGTGPFATLGGVGSQKKFTDTTIPAGTTQIEYQIQAVRSTGMSAFAILNVRLGVGGTGIIATEGKPVKLAA